MKRAMAGIAVAVLLALPAGSEAKLGRPQNDPLAASMCAQEHVALGRQAFRNKYGFEHPGRACVKVTRQLINAAWRLARKDCSAELAGAGPDYFIAEYVTADGSTVADAMTACVAEEVDTILHPDQHSGDGGDSSDL